MSILLRILGSCGFVAAILGVTLTPRMDFAMLLTFYAASFILYLTFVTQRQHWLWYLYLGIAARFILIFVFPNLSDDLYRFFWDGNLVQMGINPFAVIPSALIDDQGLTAEMRRIYPLLNSQQYHTVYPVTCQAFFATATLLAGSDINVFAMTLKSIFFLLECGTLGFLYLMLRDNGRQADIALYALNPLVIIELVGNLHCEAIMIFLLLATYRLLQKGNILASAGLYSLAVATKLVPILCLPFLWRRLKTMPNILFAGTATVITAVLFIPVMITLDGAGFFSSLDLYFRQFEFNASFYYLGRWLGFMFRGFNTIATTGPLMAMFAAVVILVYWLAERKPKLESFPIAIVTVLTLYLLFATTVHPWYISTLVAFCVLTPFRYPIAWSALVFLSYVAYRSHPPDEMLWLIAVEYVVVIGWFVMEWRSRNKNRLIIPG